MKISDEKEIKQFSKNLHEINQIFKNINNNLDCYNIVDNKIISCNTKQFPQLVIGTIKDENFIGNYSIKHKELFDYNITMLNKETKKNSISEIIIEDQSIEFVRDYQTLKFDYNNENINNYNILINKYNSFSELILETVIDDDLIYKINSNKKVFELIINTDDNKVYDADCINKNDLENYLQFFITNKYLVGSKTETKKLKSGTYITNNKCTLKLFMNSNMEDFYLIKLIIEDKYVDIEQYFIVTDIKN